MHHPVQVYLSHHDLGLLAAFPQDITEESDIPLTPSLRDFIPDASMIKKITSIGKWYYVRIITALLPGDITHVIFAPFLEQYIRGQFGRQKTCMKEKISQKQEGRGSGIFPQGAY